jgi:hypothetical protein
MDFCFFYYDDLVYLDGASSMATNLETVYQDPHLLPHPFLVGFGFLGL